MSRDFFVRQGKALEVVAVGYVKSALTQHDGKRPGMGAARLVSCSRRYWAACNERNKRASKPTKLVSIP